MCSQNTNINNEIKEYTIVDMGKGASMAIYHTNKSFKDFKKWFDYVAAIGRGPATKMNLSKSSECDSIPS